jgi:iron complex outermembrane recepter protein
LVGSFVPTELIGSEIALASRRVEITGASRFGGFMSPKLRASIHRALFAASALTATVTVGAQEQTEEIAEIVIVTGSYIRGTAEDAALPVDVISTEELEKQGAPTPVEMLKSVTVMNGIIGETNRHTANRGQAQAGATLINLRGFGENRTLTLLNGKRLANGDANLLPQNAISRVEILKDGGASTYGSDAIGGVVNFITKDRVDGLELTADYRNIEDSDGDYSAGLAWGTNFGAGNFFVAANYFHRSQLEARDRDWALRPYLENPNGGWSSASSPGSFSFGTGATTFTSSAPDPACTTFGGVILPTATPGVSGCSTHYSQWDNIVEEQDTYQLFASSDIDLSDTMSLRLEALYGRTEAPNVSATPTAATTRTPTETALGAGNGRSLFGAVPGADPLRSPFFYIPIENPGFTGAYAPGAGYVPSGATAGYIAVGGWRPYLATGSPTNDDGTQRYEFTRDNARLSAELTGELGSINWSTSATYGLYTYERLEEDFSTGKLQLALRGLGGSGCNGVRAGLAGSTCEWYNPFANSFAATRDGAANPNYTGTSNSAALVDWIEDEMSNNREESVGELNVVFSGELPWSLPGGAIGWAAGGQYRYSTVEIEYGPASDRATTPCPDTPINGDMTCTPSGESAYNFLSSYTEQDLSRGVYAGFTELSLPVFDSLNFQVAARFEDYGDEGGSSFDPKFAFKYQVIDQLALRGSVSTTFRAPQQTSLVSDASIGFQQLLGASRPVSNTGNPNLEPEESFQWTVGAIANVGNFRAMVDFWRFDIDKLLTTEPASGVLNTVFPTAATNNCATTDAAYLASRFVFAGNTCSLANLLQINTTTINGAGLRNDGIDATFDYTFDNVLGGSLVLGASGTWIHSFETETLRSSTGVVLEAGFDGVGFLNQLTTQFALPEWRAQAFIDYNIGVHNVRWTANFVDQMRDQRDGIKRGDRTAGNIFTAASPNGRLVEDRIIHNVTYRVELPANVTLLGTVENVFNEDPPFVRSELSYDPLTGLPLGRTFKLGARVSFE